jgi:AFG3 family protein
VPERGGVPFIQVAVYGMNKKVGMLSFPPNDNQFDKPYSGHTAELIDSEVREMVDELYKRTVALVEEKKHLIEKLALALLEKEVRCPPQPPSVARTHAHG